jgi:hypothetical protein
MRISGFEANQRQRNLDNQKTAIRGYHGNEVIYWNGFSTEPEKGKYRSRECNRHGPGSWCNQQKQVFGRSNLPSICYCLCGGLEAPSTYRKGNYLSVCYRGRCLADSATLVLGHDIKVTGRPCEIRGTRRAHSATAANKWYSGCSCCLDYTLQLRLSCLLPCRWLKSRLTSIVPASSRFSPRS